MDNFVYEVEEQRIGKILVNARRLDDSSEAEVDHENSIPQESSISGNVSF